MQRAAAGGGPTLIELITYRMGPHSTSDDPTVYRAKEEVERQGQRDPILKLRRYLERKQAWSGQDEEALVEQTQGELKACIDRAEAKQAPPLASMFEDVFERMPRHLQDQLRECLDGPRVRKGH
jgi:TPP-dependent pyruvate/acetoin dehydrogenase alpha subunit